MSLEFHAKQLSFRFFVLIFFLTLPFLSKLCSKDKVKTIRQQ